MAPTGEGKVCSQERKLRVVRPRKKKAQGEVPIPAYGAMQREPQLGSWMLEILLEGVSTRKYAGVMPPMAETAGVSRSSVRRQAIKAGE